MNYYVVTLTNSRKILVKSEIALDEKDLDLYFLGTVKKYRHYSDDNPEQTLLITPETAKFIKGARNEIYQDKKEAEG